MSRIIISLVGEQPAPNVLPLGYYKPDKMILVHTGRTVEIAKRIADLIDSKDIISAVRPFCEVHPFLIADIQMKLEDYLAPYSSSDHQLIFNLTGGTKTMEFAALDIARNLKAKAFYYQTGAMKSLIHPYHFEVGRLVAEEPISTETTLTLDEYLKLYLEDYNQRQRDDNNIFENNVIDVLRQLGGGYEVLPRVCPIHLPNVEIDFVLRYRNKIAVGEVKETAKKRAIEQLNSLTDQRILGTYIGKFIVHLNKLKKNNYDLTKAYNITPIRMQSGSESSLSDEDTDLLMRSIQEVMEPDFS